VAGRPETFTPAAPPVDEKIQMKEPGKTLMGVDRIEEGYAILIPEDDPEEIIHVPLRYLPGVREGDIVECIFRRDEVATREARDRIGRIRERLVYREEV